MSGDIYFGYDKSNPEAWRKNDGYVNTPTFAAFGELLDEALLGQPSELVEAIKEGEPMAIYSFTGLSASDYNAVIRAIRSCVSSVTEPTPGRERALWVWREMAEPFIRKDERYDYAFHQEMPPAA